MNINKMSKRLPLVIACLAVGLPVASANASVKYKLTCSVTGDNPSNPTDITSTIKCKKPFGTGKQTGKLVLPKATGKWKFKGGAFSYVGIGTIDGQTAKSSITLTKGTGKFKGCKVKGTQVYDLAAAKGTAKLNVTCRKAIK